jgi:hypothetical protein
MRQHTERELKLWLLWLREEWNRPDRTDHYLMQIAAEIRRNGKIPIEVTTDQFRLPFVFGDDAGPAGEESATRPPAPTLTKEQASEIARQRLEAKIGKAEVVSEHPHMAWVRKRFGDKAVEGG